MADDEQTVTRMIPSRQIDVDEFSEAFESIVEQIKLEDHNGETTPIKTFEDWLERVLVTYHSPD